MTANQIAYWTLQETKRANTVREGETHRTNVRHEGIEESKVTESRRHNLADEQIRSGTLTESKRHNVATEGIERLKAESQKERWESQSAIDRGNMIINAVRVGTSPITNLLR